MVLGCLAAITLTKENIILRSCSLLALLLLLLGQLVHAAEVESTWPQFLGLNRDGVVRETGLNLDWQTKKPKVLWKVPLIGFSSESFAGNKLFTQTKRGDRDIVVCLEAATGKELWALDVASSYLDKQRQGPGPRATPTYVNGRLYCLFPRGELLCVDAQTGKEIWKTNILEVTGAGQHEGVKFYWGMSGSPLVEGDVVIVQPGGNKNNSVAAFHKDTGKLVWSLGEDLPGYASPIVITVSGRRHVVCPTASFMFGVDPAKGTVLWKHAWGDDTNCNCATPLWVDNLLFMSRAYNYGCAALEITADGDRFTVKEKWKNKNLLNHFMTSMIVDGHVYGAHGDFSAYALRCVDLQTGQLKWTERNPGRCALLAVDKHLICWSENGTLRLVEANPESFVVKGEIPDLLAFKAWSAPALYQKRLYLRDLTHLLCLDLSLAEKSQEPKSK